MYSGAGELPILRLCRERAAFLLISWNNDFFEWWERCIRRWLTNAWVVWRDEIFLIKVALVTFGEFSLLEFIRVSLMHDELLELRSFSPNSRKKEEITRLEESLLLGIYRLAHYLNTRNSR